MGKKRRHDAQQNDKKYMTLRLWAFSIATPSNTKLKFSMTTLSIITYRTTTLSVITVSFITICLMTFAQTLSKMIFSITTLCTILYK
jgi:hypothetical protein